MQDILINNYIDNFYLLQKWKQTKAENNFNTTIMATGRRREVGFNCVLYNQHHACRFYIKGFLKKPQDVLKFIAWLRTPKSCKYLRIQFNWKFLFMLNLIEGNGENGNYIFLIWAKSDLWSTLSYCNENIAYKWTREKNGWFNCRISIQYSVHYEKKNFTCRKKHQLSGLRWWWIYNIEGYIKWSLSSVPLIRSSRSLRKDFIV